VLITAVLVSHGLQTVNTMSLSAMSQIAFFQATMSGGTSYIYRLVLEEAKGGHDVILAT